MATATIRVDAPDGWVPVDYRPPKRGERFIGVGTPNCVVLAAQDYPPGACRIIVVPERKPLVFPDELLPWNGIAGIAKIGSKRPRCWGMFASKPRWFLVPNPSSWEIACAVNIISEEHCPWLPDATGYEWYETWIEHPEWSCNENQKNA